MLRTHRAGKGPGSYGGWGLGSRNRRGPGVPPTPGLRGQGTSPGSPAGFLGSSRRDKRPPLLSCSSHLPLLFSLGLLPIPLGPMRPGGGVGPGGQRTGLGSSAGSPGRVGRADALRSSPSPPGGSLPSAFPDLPGLRGADPVWLPLLLPLQPPTSYRFTWGFLPSPWASRSPPVAGRHPSWEMLTWHLPTPPS